MCLVAPLHVDSSHTRGLHVSPASAAELTTGPPGKPQPWEVFISKLHFLYYLEVIFFFFKYKFIYFNWRLITILDWFCHTSTWICYRCTCVPHPETPSHLPPRTIPLGHPSAPAPSILYPASNLDWRFVSYMILYIFQCHSPKSSHPRPPPQSPKDCSIHLCLFCCLTCRFIITIFLNSIYMR